MKDVLALKRNLLVCGSVLDPDPADQNQFGSMQVRIRIQDTVGNCYFFVHNFNKKVLLIFPGAFRCGAGRGSDYGVSARPPRRNRGQTAVKERRTSSLNS